MANEYLVNSDDLTGVADAIREKGGTSGQLVFPDGFVTAIQGIEGGSAIPPMPSFTYSVEDGYEIVTDEETGAWKIRFLTSGVLVFTSEPPLTDIWMCGAGGGSSGKHVGSGGGSGYVNGKLKCQLAMGEEYTITIGAGGKAGNDGNGGTGGETSAFNITAKGGSGGMYSSGKGGNGGTGGNASRSDAPAAIDGANGKSSSSYVGGTGNGTTTREFWEADGTLYCSGGATNKTAKGEPNTGAGGSCVKTPASGAGTAGGSGIVIIRGSLL